MEPNLNLFHPLGAFWLLNYQSVNYIIFLENCVSFEDAQYSNFISTLNQRFGSK
jgi:hypothetical protein